MSFDMPPEDFRRFGHQVVDWIADYLAGIREYPVLPTSKPGDLTRALPSEGPEEGENMARILEDFRDLVVPHSTHWNHPRFHAYFAISASGPGILGEMLTAAMNMNGMLWKSSPAVTELEQVTLAWLRQWLGLPDDLFGLIYDTASISTMHAIAAAREARFPEVRVEGGLRDAVLYTSEHAHSSIEKGAITLGVGQSNVRKIGVDMAFRMRPDLLAAAVEADLAAGRQPFCVVATVGTTSTSSIDPVPAIAAIAERFRLWLHVDGAYGGSAAVVPELRHVLDGAAGADSLTFNPHKWLFTPIDVSVFYTRHPDVLRRAFSLVPEYLRTAEDSDAVNLMDYGVQLGRRFRALKLWFVLRYFGREGLAAVIREHVRLAQEFAAWVRASGDFELAAPVPFALVCFRRRGSDDDNRRLLDAVNASGRAFLSHTVLNGRFVLRLAIGNIKTTREDLEDTWSLIQTHAQELAPAS
jgi:aromatic-L-amino-acid/L-tryptophan decarboxylase